MTSSEGEENGFSAVLAKKYQKLFKHPICVDCGAGWDELIDRLCKDLEHLITDDLGDIYVTQIKEKYGTLRFYLSLETDEMSRLIDKAEEDSRSICEVCGMPGELIINRGRWFFVRCDDHSSDIK